MSKTCKSCKHFSPIPPWDPVTSLVDDKSGKHGTCLRWHRGSFVATPGMETNEAWVEDDEGWANVVGPDFGCVLHEVAS